jgi:dTDP-4-amino-4,6-dideoxygalactose transaminase
MAGPGAYWVGEEERREVLDVLDGGHLYRYGDLEDPKFKRKVLTFEKEFAEYSGAAYCQATSSGTSSILISLNAIGIKPGDEIIIPTYTFIASYGAAIFLGAVPVLCEIDESLTMDPEDVDRRITPKTKAIMPVHILGNPCNMDAIMDVAKKQGIMVVEDCCQACGASYKGKKIGTFGELGAFSLNLHKTITSGDGGMVITDKKQYFEHAFAMQDQGHKPMGGGLSRMPPSILGLNFRINELTGAVALAQLRKIDRIISTLHQKKQKLKRLVSGIPGTRFRQLNDEQGECATLLTVIFDDAERAAKVSRALGTHTVDDTGWHVYSNMDQVNRHLEEIDRPHDLGAYPRTDDVLKRSINISVGVVDDGLGAGWGIFIDSTDEEIEEVGAQFVRACEEAE